MKTAHWSRLAAWGAASAIVLLAMARLLNGRIVVDFQDELITSGEARHFWDSFLAHTPKQRCLRVFGVWYTGVRGYKPYYLTIPSHNAALFVTEDRKGKVVFHVVYRNESRHICIEGGSSSFGWGIGGTRTAGELFTDYVSQVEGSRVSLVSQRATWREEVVLDLEKRRIVK